MGKKALAPLAGVVAVGLVVGGFAVGGEPPEASDPVAEIVDHYLDNEGAVIASAVMVAWGAVFLVFFANYLRGVFRSAEGDGGTLSALTLAGASIAAVGAALDGTIYFALAEAADDIDPMAVQALQALWDTDFLPVATGLSVFMLASGISVVRNGALPAWLGWIAIPIGIAVLSPAGFFGFIATMAWILIVSIVLLLRERAAATA